MQSEQLFFRVIRTAFAMRRKTLANNLMAAFSFTRGQTEEILEKCGLKSDVRGEALGLLQLGAVADAVGSLAPDLLR